MVLAVVGAGLRFVVLRVEADPYRAASDAGAAAAASTTGRSAHHTGSPAKRTSSRPMPRTHDAGDGVESFVGFASPFVTSCRRVRRTTTRWVLFRRTLRVGEDRDVPDQRRRVLVGDATRRRRRRAGPIEPLSMRYGRHPMSVGSSVTTRAPPEPEPRPGRHAPGERPAVRRSGSRGRVGPVAAAAWRSWVLLSWSEGGRISGDPTGRAGTAALRPGGVGQDCACQLKTAVALVPW